MHAKYNYITHKLDTGTEDLRDLEYPRALVCCVPSVARALLKARGYSKSCRSRR